MADFPRRVIALSRAAWRMREAARVPCRLPFALALFSDPARLPIERLAAELPEGIPPILVILRHDRLLPERRVALGRETMATVRARGHLFSFARGYLQGADGAHAAGPGPGLRSAPAHDAEEVAKAEGWAHALFVSPVFPTRSHPGAPALGPAWAEALASLTAVPCFALGGMDESRAGELAGGVFQGFGAIDAFGGVPD